MSPSVISAAENSKISEKLIPLGTMGTSKTPFKPPVNHENIFPLRAPAIGPSIYTETNLLLIPLKVK